MNFPNDSLLAQLIISFFNQSFLLADRSSFTEREWSVLSQKYTNLEHVSTLRISENPRNVAAYSSRGRRQNVFGAIYRCPR